MEGTQVLFWGEFTIKPDGIYTYAHYYEHAEIKRKVVMVGMNHGGDREYFEKVAEILQDCEIIIYESSTTQRQTAEELRKDAEEDLKAMLSDDLNEAFFPAIRTYFRRASEYLRLATESESFDYRKPGWESGDEEFFLRLQDDENYQQFLYERTNKFLENLGSRKKAVIEFAKNTLKRIESGEFSKKDFAESFVFLWSDEPTTKIILELLSHPRDEITFEKFDKIVREKNPRSVGIKFGAAHVNYQRQLLEQRGYVWQRSVELCNMKF